MTVSELFQAAGVPLSGPARWRHLDEVIEDLEQIPEKPGIYVVARVREPNEGCAACDLPFGSIPSYLGLDHQYEFSRWLVNEPILYVGKTEEDLRERINAFRRH